MPCKARQVSDQMTCHECKLTWDKSDPEPPVCEREKTVECHCSEEEQYVCIPCKWRVNGAKL